MSLYEIADEELWNSARPPKYQTRVTRPVLWEYISDVISDAGSRHCYLIKRHVKGEELRTLSEKLSGDIWGRPNYFSHSAGQTSEVYIHKDHWQEFLGIRETTQSLVGYEDVGWVPSQCARHVDKWLNFREPPATPELKKMLLPNYSFSACLPCKLPQAYYHDMSGAYWQIVSAAPTPKLVMSHRLPLVVGWRNMTAEQRDKWEAMVNIIAPHKAARLAIVGNWVGEYGFSRWKYSAHWHYRKGKRIRTLFHRPSTLSTFGLLVVRMVYELCQEEFLQDKGVSAWVDGVITQSPLATYWDALGIPSTPKHSGELTLYTPTSYVLGNHKAGDFLTEYSKKHNRIVPQLVRPQLVPRNMYYHRKLLPKWGAIPRTIEDLPPQPQLIKLPPSQLLLPRLRIPPSSRPPVQPL